MISKSSQNWFSEPLTTVFRTSGNQVSEPLQMIFRTSEKWLSESLGNHLSEPLTNGLQTSEKIIFRKKVVWVADQEKRRGCAIIEGHENGMRNRERSIQYIDFQEGMRNRDFRPRI